MGITNLFKKNLGKEYEQLLEKMTTERARIEQEIVNLESQRSTLNEQKEAALSQLHFEEVEKLVGDIEQIQSKINSKKGFLEYLMPEKSVALQKAALQAYEEVVKKQEELRKEGEKLETAILNKALELNMLLDSATNLNNESSALSLGALDFLAHIEDADEKRKQVAKLFKLNSSVSNPDHHNAIPAVNRFYRSIHGDLQRLLNNAK